MQNKNKLSICLWFDGGVEEAAKFYTQVFQNAKMLGAEKFPDDAPARKEGDTMTNVIELEGIRIMLLNGGPYYKFNEAISLVINCENQEEVDYYWDALIDTSKGEGQCGWIKDKYGLSWQVVPKQLGELMSNPDKVESKKVFDNMMKMKKIVIADLTK